MADSAVDITVGSGTSIDTRTEASNGNHRQVVVLGDPSVNAGVAPVDGTLGLATFFKTQPTVSVVGGIAAGSTLTAYQGGGAWLTTLATLPVVTNISGYALEAGNLATIVTSLSDIKAKTDNLDVTLGSRLASGGTLPITGQVSALAAGGSLSAFQGGTWTAQPGNTPNTTAWLTTQATLPVVANINNSSLPVTQSGTWTVQPGNTPNTTAWLVTMATIPVVANVNVAGQATVTAIQGDPGTRAWLATLATLPVVTNVTGYALEAGNLATIVTTLNNIKAKTDNLDVTLGSRLGSGATLPITGTINSLAAGGSLTSYQGGTWTVQPGNTPNTTAWLVTLATLSVIGSFSAAGQATVTAIQGDPGTKAWLATLATLPVMAGQAGNWSMLAAGGSLSAAQLGTWTVQPGNTPNTVGWLTTLATLPVVANINNTTLAVTQSGTWDEVGINDSGNSITVDNAQLSVVGTGTEAAAMRVTIATDSTGVLSVDDNGAALTVDGTVTANLAAGTNAIGKLAANSGVDIGDVDVTSLPALAAGTNAIGKVIPPDYDVTSHTAKAVKYYTSAGAATDGIIWSPAAGKRWHVTSLFINVSAAATVTLEDDLAAGDNAVMKMELAANSGVAIPFGDLYPFTSAEDAADLLITTTAGNVYVTAVGYEI